MLEKNKPSKTKLKTTIQIASLRNETGAALIMALLVMVVMISLVPVAMQLSSGEIHQSKNYKENRKAFFLAEAGLEHAKSLTEESSLRAALAGPDDLVSAISGNTTDDNDNGTFNTGTPILQPDGYLYNEVALGDNNYYIRAYDNNDGDPNFDIDNTIILHSIGTVNGITTSVEAVVYNPPGIPVSAVTTNDNLEVAGSSIVSGDCGSVHSNEDLTMSGTPSVLHDATATGTYTLGGSVGGTEAGGESIIPIPQLDPVDFRPYADYILDNNGDVYDSSGNFVSSSPWNGWTHSTLPSTWEKGGPTAFDASLFIEGNAILRGNAGSPGTPWNITIVATGYIDVSGNLVFANLKNPAHPVNIQNLIFVAGTDIKYNGNSNQVVDGLIYALDQLHLSGNPTINGAALAYDATTSESLVFSNLVTGDVIINYGCGLTIPSGSVDLEVISWKEL